MDGTLFEEWLHELDHKFEMQGKKVAMIVDKCPDHSEVSGLKAFKLQFLSPITTSVHSRLIRGLSGMFALLFSNSISNVNRIAIEYLDFAVEGLHC